VKNDLLYGLMRVGFSAAQVLPMRGPLRLLGCVAPHIFLRPARRARRQLREVLPDLDAVKVTRRMFVHFAESLWELSRLHRTVPKLDSEARRTLDAALAEGKGAVLISGHIGNWELMGRAIAAAGYPIATVAKPLTIRGLPVVGAVANCTVSKSFGATRRGQNHFTYCGKTADGFLSTEHQDRGRLRAVLRTAGSRDDAGGDRYAHRRADHLLLASSPSETA
jgi:hypothetical protein